MKRGFPSLEKRASVSASAHPGLIGLGIRVLHLNDIEFPLTEILLRGVVCNVCNPRVEGVAWRFLLGPHDFDETTKVQCG